MAFARLQACLQRIGTTHYSPPKLVEGLPPSVAVLLAVSGEAAKQGNRHGECQQGDQDQQPDRVPARAGERGRGRSEWRMSSRVCLARVTWVYVRGQIVPLHVITIRLSQHFLGLEA